LVFYTFELLALEVAPPYLLTRDFESLYPGFLAIYLELTPKDLAEKAFSEYKSLLYYAD